MEIPGICFDLHNCIDNIDIGYLGDMVWIKSVILLYLRCALLS